MYVYIYTYMHTCIHTYIHTYICNKIMLFIRKYQVNLNLVFELKG